MKKRKFPAGLVVMLVVLLGAAGAYSVVNTSVANRTPEENARIMQEEAARNAPKPAADATPAVPDKEAVRSQIQQSVSKGGAEGEAPQLRGRPGAPEAAPGSSILVPKSTPYKPVPNESGTPSQWFEKR